MTIVILKDSYYSFSLNFILRKLSIISADRSRAISSIRDSRPVPILYVTNIVAHVVR